MTDWYGPVDGSPCHGFSEAAWMRSLCGAVRWSAALIPTPDAPARCDACVALADGPVVQVVRTRETQIATAERRHAIARAASRRRWRRTS